MGVKVNNTGTKRLFYKGAGDCYTKQWASRKGMKTGSGSSQQDMMLKKSKE